MQRNVLIPMLAAGILCMPPAFAQSNQGRKEQYSKNETVVIKGDRQRTVIEIKDGRVYVNGDPVVTIDDDAANVRKKIIIENNAGPQEEGTRDYSWKDIDREEMPATRQAMLGVLSGPDERGEGALIREVTPNSPAATAGLRAGDRILSIDNRRIADGSALFNEITQRHQPGDEVTIAYERNGKTRNVTATLTTAPANRNTMRMYRFDDQDKADNRSGHQYREFRFPDMNGNEDDRPKLGVTIEDRSGGFGVIVRSVAPGSAAARAGIRTGDILQRVDDEQIRSVSDLQERVRRSAPGEKVNLQYERNGRMLSADVILSAPVRKKDL